VEIQLLQPLKILFQVKQRSETITKSHMVEENTYLRSLVIVLYS